MNSLSSCGTLKAITALCCRNDFYLVGSRAVLPDTEIGETADFDFIAADSLSNREYLLSKGFVEKKFGDYVDESTVAMYEAGLGVPVQVTLRKPECMPALKTMWELMKANPELYRQKLWKRSTGVHKSREGITQYINSMVKLLTCTVPQSLSPVEFVLTIPKSE